MTDKVLKCCVAAMLLTALVGCGGQKSDQPAATGTPSFEASVRVFEPVQAAYVEVTGPVDQMGEALGRLMAWSVEKQVQPAGAPFAVYLTSPAMVVPESMEYQVCLPVPDGTTADSAAGIAVKEFGGMELAVARHVGPFEAIEETYTGLEQWADEHKYVIAGPAVEFYLSNPQTTPAESLVTEVGFAVKPMPAGQQPE